MLTRDWTKTGPDTYSYHLDNFAEIVVRFNCDDLGTFQVYFGNPPSVYHNRFGWFMSIESMDELINKLKEIRDAL